MGSDWSEIRREFPALSAWTYLNSATFGQMPARAAAAMNRHIERRDRFACADFMEWFDDIDRLRATVGQLVGCSGDDVAFIPNASSALSLLLGGLEWGPGDQIVTLADEFPNHYYYPAHLGAAGVEFVETAWDRFYDALTERTRLVALSEVNFSTGFRAPVEEIAQELRRRGILFYLDGTQSTGALRCDLARTQPDLFALDAYKWMLSPNGAGFMYVSPALRERLAPSVIGWRSHREWRNTEQLHQGAPTFSGTAERYEGGMIPFAPLYAMGAVIELMLEIGPEAIERRVLGLATQTRELLRRHGAVVPPGDSQVVCAAFPGRDVSALVRQLKERHVIVSARQGNLRVSAHFYNGEADLERLDSALGDLL
jgi:cysteine desulfurase / selenocysteine lyase